MRDSGEMGIHPLQVAHHVQMQAACFRLIRPFRQFRELTFSRCPLEFAEPLLFLDKAQGRPQVLAHEHGCRQPELSQQVIMHGFRLRDLPPRQAQAPANALGRQIKHALIHDVPGMLKVESDGLHMRKPGAFLLAEFTLAQLPQKPLQRTMQPVQNVIHSAQLADEPVIVTPQQFPRSFQHLLDDIRHFCLKAARMGAEQERR